MAPHRALAVSLLLGPSGETPLSFILGLLEERRKTTIYGNASG